jgi:hypothetical protein
MRMNEVSIPESEPSGQRAVRRPGNRRFVHVKYLGVCHLKKNNRD